MNFKEKLRFLITLKKIRQLAITGPHFSMTSFRDGEGRSSQGIY